MSNEKLTAKQERFIYEYIKDCNATKAAIRSGYSVRSAEVTGFRLLRNAKVLEEIHKQKEKIVEDLRQMFIGDAILARKVMLEVLNDPNATNRDKITVARDLLDRAGFGPIDKKELSGSNGGAIEIAFVEPKF